MFYAQISTPALLTVMLGLDVQNQPCQVLSSVLSLTWTSFRTGGSRRRCGLFLSTPFPAFNTSSNWKFGWPCLFTWLKCGEVVFIFSWRWLSRAALQSHPLRSPWEQCGFNMSVQLVRVKKVVRSLIFFNSHLRWMIVR